MRFGRGRKEEERRQQSPTCPDLNREENTETDYFDLSTMYLFSFLIMNSGHFEL